MLEYHHATRIYETSLSFPGIVCKVERYNKIKVNYLSPQEAQLKNETVTLRNDAAFAFQAGLDQLNGINMLDKALSTSEDLVLKHFGVYIQQKKPKVYRILTGSEDFPWKFDYVVENRMERMFSGMKIEKLPDIKYLIGVDMGYEEPKQEQIINPVPEIIR